MPKFKTKSTGGSTRARMARTLIHPKIKKLAKDFGVEIRIGKSPKDVLIETDPLPESIVACYFGQGVVFVRSETIYSKEDMNIVILHELGHAVLDFFVKGGLKMDEWLEEVSCDHIALAWAAQLRLPVSPFMIKNFNKLNKGEHEIHKRR